ncbi:MAG: hypothetical protein AAB647_03900 [Patescibacteria group bacterium]
MKLAITIQWFNQFWQTVRQAGLTYFIIIGLTFGLGGLSWYIWHQFGADQTIPASYLLTAHSLVLLNIGLSLGILKREAFASSLLAGTAFIYEILVLVFLYLI